MSSLLELRATDNQPSILLDSLAGLSCRPIDVGADFISGTIEFVRFGPRLEPRQSFAKSICAEIQSRNYLIQLLHSPERKNRICAGLTPEWNGNGIVTSKIEVVLFIPVSVPL
jgi:hypothetical protein